MGFQKFKEVFYEKYQEGIYNFIDDSEDNSKELPFGLVLEANNDCVEHDSYGSEDSTLERVFYSEEFGIYVKFFGTRQSYSGEEWDGFYEVKKRSKTIIVWENAE